MPGASGFAAPAAAGAAGAAALAGTAAMYSAGGKPGIDGEVPAGHAHLEPGSIGGKLPDVSGSVPSTSFGRPDMPGMRAPDGPDMPDMKGGVKMPGMPDMPKMSGMKAPDGPDMPDMKGGVKMPGMPDMPKMPGMKAPDVAAPGMLPDCFCLAVLSPQ